jgi:adenylate kinase family enzyme
MAVRSRIHITGASGSGTTTLGRDVAQRLRIPHAVDGWVLSGSLAGWGDPIKDRFDLVVFLYAPTSVRLERLKRRELERYGREALGPGGVMHASHLAFLAWASRYDEGDEWTRSRRLHEAWLADLRSTVLRVDASRPIAELTEEVLGV